MMSLVYFNFDITPSESSLSLHDALPIEGPLLVLDHLVLEGDVDGGEELLLADEGPFLQPLARKDHVGQPDQAAGEQLEDRKGTRLNTPCNLVCRLLLETI